MGWPFLWPSEESWPVCQQRNPEIASRLEAGLERAEAKGLDSDHDRLGRPTPREIATPLIERYRSGHNSAYLPVLQLSRPEFPERPFEVTPALVASLDSEEDWWRTMEDSGPAPGTKLLGFPKWVQGPDYPRCRRCELQMDLLITISSTEFRHGGNDDIRWIPSEDRNILSNAPFSLREEYELPHGWMIGDGGDAYLFHCPNCRGEFDSRVPSS
jgi:hypothetical protein